MSFKIVDNRLVKYTRTRNETEIVIPEGVTAVASGAFVYSDVTGKNGIKSIVLPDSMKCIESVDIFLFGTVDEVSISAGTFLVPNQFLSEDKHVLKRLTIRQSADDGIFSQNSHIANILSVLHASRVDIDFEMDLSKMCLKSSYLAEDACLCAPEMKLSSFPCELRFNAALGYLRLVADGRKLNGGIRRSYRNTIRGDVMLLETILKVSLKDEDMISALLSERLIGLSDIEWAEGIVRANDDTSVIAEFIEYRNSFSDEEREEYEERMLRAPTLSEARREWTVTLNTADETACLSEYKGKQTEVYVPSEVGKYAVTELGWFGFESLNMFNIPVVQCSVESVFIPEGIKSIGVNAFNGCTSLSSVTLPTGLEYIGINAFMNCFALRQDIELPETLFEIGYGCFSNSGIQSVSIPATVGHIPSHAFSACKELSSVNIADGFTLIDDCAFEGCHMLNTLDIPDSVDTIHRGAFGESGLKSITLPQKLDRISEELFYWCSDLSSVKTGSDIFLIDNNAFFHCSSLSEFEFPANLRRIGISAFEASGIEAVLLPQSVRTVGRYAFADCDSLREVVLSDSISRITGNCFNSCHALETIHLPQKLKKIGPRAFEACSSLKELHIPDGAVALGERAFSQCSSLEKLYIPSSVTEIGNELLKDSEKCVIYAPSGSYAIEYAKSNSIKYVEI